MNVKNTKKTLYWVLSKCLNTFKDSGLLHYRHYNEANFSQTPHLMAKYKSDIFQTCFKKGKQRSSLNKLKSQVL